MNARFQRRVSQSMVLAVLLGAISAPAGFADEPKTKLPPGLIRGPSKEILALVIRGRTLRNQGDRNTALAIFEDALQKAREAQDRSGEAWAMNNIASVYRYEGTDQRAQEHSQRATALYDQARVFALANGDKHNAAYATLYLGVLAEQRGEIDQATTLSETALPLFKEVDDPYYVARTYTFLGQTALTQRKDPLKAIELFEQALPGFREVEMWHEAAAVVRDMFLAYERLARGRAQPAKAKDPK
jgi:tetratricopeptide (TPR) repeat protein